MTTTDATVQDLLAVDQWVRVHGSGPSGHSFLRYRTPVVGAGGAGDFTTRVSVTWPYADEDTGALPDQSDQERLARFENHLVDAWEKGNIAILAAVLTFDGARQWVFYTRDVDECERRLSAMPQEEEPYPLELLAEDDSEWSYLRDDILGPKVLAAGHETGESDGD